MRGGNVEERDEVYYNVQCAGCAMTIRADALPEGKDYTWIMQGELCSGCQQQEEDSYYDDDD
jgi:MinD superfamily P-loop ATPase